jgi:hypothetical protein
MSATSAIRDSLLSQISDDPVDDLHSQLFGFRGQMGIDSGGGWRSMTEPGLNQTKIDSRFEQVCRPRMAQGINTLLIIRVLRFITVTIRCLEEKSMSCER